LQFRDERRSPNGMRRQVANGKAADQEAIENPNVHDLHLA
jgi:hypothetical protein